VCAVSYERGTPVQERVGVCAKRFDPLHELEQLKDADPRYRLAQGVKRFRGGIVLKAHRLFVSHNSRLESNKEEEGEEGRRVRADPLPPRPRQTQRFAVKLLDAPVLTLDVTVPDGIRTRTLTSPKVEPN